MAVVAPESVRPGLAYRTTALGTRVEMVVTDSQSLDRAVRLFHQELERIDLLASRFRPDSEIVRLNASAGRSVRVSEPLLELLVVALGAAEATDGAVDPTVGSAVCQLGYDRQFVDVVGGRDGELPPERPVPGWRTVDVDVTSGVVRTPPGVQIDLGATAKALAADRIADVVHRVAKCGVLVSLGGDIAMAGAPVEGFVVGLGEVCGISSGTDTVAVTSGGLATSGIGARQWRLGNHLVHHLVDPSTGLPVAPVWRTVSVCAASCVDANAASTAAMVKGTDAARWLVGHKLPARLVDMDGTVVTVGGWPAADGPSDGFR